MSEAQTKPIDKSTWGPGPWQSEPDRWEGEHLGFPVLALRGPSGNWCGYAAVPPGHPWHGKDAFREVEADVHGGLTYGGLCSGNICHVPKPGEPDNVYWLGFDCHHSGDIAPGDEAYYAARGHYGISEHYASYRTLDYVKRECERLAEQARDAASSSPAP